MLTEHGEILDAEDFDAARNAAFDNNLLTVAGPLTQQQWLNQAVTDPETEVLLSERTVAGIRMTNPRDKRQKRWIVPVSAWFESREPEASHLPILRRVFDHVGIGVAPTPSGLGMRLLATRFEGERWLQPRIATWEKFHDTVIGGRVDTLRDLEHFDRAWGQDMRLAYTSNFMRVPAGEAELFYGKPKEEYATYYQHCRIWAAGCEGFGPVPWRHPSGRVLYPTDGAGLLEGDRYYAYDTWLWKEEEGDLRVAGGQILERFDGYGFSAFSTAASSWANFVGDLRRRSPDRAVSAAIKRLAVGAIGRCMVPLESARLIPDDGQGSVYVDGLTGFDGTPYKVDRALMVRDAMLPHVASYAWMQTRRQLYALALPYARRGTLISTNYDEVLTSEPPLWRSSAGLGGLKTSVYTDLSVPYARAKRGTDSHGRSVKILPGIRRVA